MKKAKDIFTQGDAFGTNPKLFINNSTKFKTPVGSFFTILLGLIVAGACWIYGKDLYYKLNPNSIFTEESTLHPEKFVVTKDKFNLALGITRADWVHYIDESIYTVKMQRELYTNYVNSETGQIEPKHEILDLNARRCKPSDFGLAPEYFQNLAFLTDLYCMDNYENSFIEGDYGAEVLSMINGVVEPCRNSTDVTYKNAVVCKSPEQIDEALKDTFWAFYFTDSFINPKNFTDPFVITGRNEYGFCSNSMFRSLDFYFRNIYIEDNTGIIFDSWSDKRGIAYSYYKEMSKNEPKEDGTFLTFSMRFEKVKQTRIFRTYLNMAQVVANVGGILKVFMLGFLIISQYVATKYYNIDLANSLFGFKYEKNQNNKNKGKGKQKQQQQDTKKNNNIVTSQLKFKSFLNLFSSFWQSDETKTQQKMLDFTVTKLAYHLDVKRILQKLIELDKLKMLLLNDNQINLFEYLPKPEITEDMIIQHEDQKLKNMSENDNINVDREKQQLKQKKKLNILEEDQRSQQQKHKDAFLAFKLIKSKSKNKGKIDSRILEIMDEKLREQFENEYSEEMYNNPQEYSIHIQQSNQQLIKNNLNEEYIGNDTDIKSKSYNFSSGAVDQNNTQNYKNSQNQIDKIQEEKSKSKISIFQDFDQDIYDNDINSERLEQSTKMDRDTNKRTSIIKQFDQHNKYRSSSNENSYKYSKKNYQNSQQSLNFQHQQQEQHMNLYTDNNIHYNSKYVYNKQTPSKTTRYRGKSSDDQFYLPHINFQKNLQEPTQSSNNSKHN